MPIYLLLPPPIPKHPLKILFHLAIPVCNHARDIVCEQAGVFEGFEASCPLARHIFNGTVMILFSVSVDCFVQASGWPERRESFLGFNGNGNGNGNGKRRFQVLGSEVLDQR